MLLVSGGSEHFTGRVARIATCMHAYDTNPSILATVHSNINITVHNACGMPVYIHVLVKYTCIGLRG